MPYSPAFIDLNHMNLNEKIDKIDLKARQLGLKLEHLQERNEKLIGENRKLQHQLGNAINMIADLEERLELAESALSKKQDADPSEIKEMRQQLDDSIDDIDKTIDWLENS